MRQWQWSGSCPRRRRESLSARANSGKPRRPAGQWGARSARRGCAQDRSSRAPSEWAWTSAEVHRLCYSRPYSRRFSLVLVIANANIVRGTIATLARECFGRFALRLRPRFYESPRVVRNAAARYPSVGPYRRLRFRSSAEAQCSSPRGDDNDYAITRDCTRDLERARNTVAAKYRAIDEDRRHNYAILRLNQYDVKWRDITYAGGSGMPASEIVGTECVVSRSREFREASVNDVNI